MEQKQFLAKYRISSADFEATAIDWNDLESIFREHSDLASEYVKSGQFLAEVIRENSFVHSVRMRVKDPEHLIAKVIRKKLDKPEDQAILFADYKNRVTDLIGLRVLHLYKDQWRSVHQFLASKWDFKETPTANIRKGDVDVQFKELDLEIFEHTQGYRSIHYLVQFQPTKESQIAEIQVRTLFEEAWSEIDHELRYPLNTDDPILAGHLQVFNIFAGGADAMGSYARKLRDSLNEYREQIRKHNAEIAQLKNEVSNLTKDSEEKKTLQKRIAELEKTAPNESLSTSLAASPYYISSAVKGLMDSIASLPKIDPAIIGAVADVAKLSMEKTPLINSGLYDAIKPYRPKKK